MVCWMRSGTCGAEFGAKKHVLEDNCRVTLLGGKSELVLNLWIMHVLKKKYPSFHDLKSRNPSKPIKSLVQKKLKCMVKKQTLLKS